VDAALAAIIDHTLLRADARRADVERLCDEAQVFSFASVCVNPIHVALSRRRLDAARSKIPVCSVIGFPLGATTTDVKVREIEAAADHGAREFDAVLHIGALLDGDVARVARDVSAVTRRAKALVPGAVVKIIIETALLDDDARRAACSITAEAGADFVKTSTGFAGGASVADVALLRAIAPPLLGIKASGGIRTHRAACALRDAGASRIGSSAGPVIVTSLADSEEES
jgi:deoxyribose-phosphate aldolase